jgi:salicylate hydroxylase
MYFIRNAERITDWELWYGNGVSHLCEGKTLLVGDAAHSMLPFTGQGGSQGIEDSGALGVLFRDIENMEEIAERLKLVDDLRRERTAIFQSLAGVHIGLEAQFAKDNPAHLIHKTNIRSPETNLEYMSK